MINPIVKTIELPDGRTITLETGKLAKQADGSVMLRMGNTMLLATVCAAKDAVPGTDFMPLQVEYKEKYSAFGRFPGGFTKREGKASDYEILTCRLVDRALRPLFPDNFHAEVYVNIVLFSADGIDMPDALAGLAASAALAVSDIPFGGPISEVRVARIDGQFVINPTFEQLEKADMDLMVAATYDNIMMVEGEMQEVSEQDLLAAMKAAHEAIKVHCKAQMELMEEVGSTVKREYCHEENDEDLRKAVREACYDKAYAIAASGNRNKHERQDAFDAIRDEFKTQYTEEELEELEQAVKEFEEAMKEDNLGVLAAADVRVHEVIYGSTHNKRLVQIISNIREQMYRYRVEYLKDVESRRTLVEEHYAVYRALKARNQQQAVKDICIHIVNQQNAILRSLEQMNKEEQEK